MFTPEEQAQHEINSQKLKGLLAPVYAKYEPIIAQIRTLPFSEICEAVGDVVPEFVYAEFLEHYLREDGSLPNVNEMTDHLLAYMLDWLVDMDCEETGLLSPENAETQAVREVESGYYLLQYTSGDDEELETDWYYELQHAIVKTMQLAEIYQHPEFNLWVTFSRYPDGELTTVYSYDHRNSFTFVPEMLDTSPAPQEEE
jgi:hypothetical protein